MPAPHRCTPARVPNCPAPPHFVQYRVIDVAEESGINPEDIDCPSFFEGMPSLLPPLPRRPPPGLFEAAPQPQEVGDLAPPQETAGSPNEVGGLSPPHETAGSAQEVGGLAPPWHPPAASCDAHQPQSAAVSSAGRGRHDQVGVAGRFVVPQPAGRRPGVGRRFFNGAVSSAGITLEGIQAHTSILYLAPHIVGEEALRTGSAVLVRLQAQRVHFQGAFKVHDMSHTDYAWADLLVASPLHAALHSIARACLQAAPAQPGARRPYVRPCFHLSFRRPRLGEGQAKVSQPWATQSCVS